MPDMTINDLFLIIGQKEVAIKSLNIDLEVANNEIKNLKDELGTCKTKVAQLELTSIKEQ